MLTPAFELSQDDTFLTICIRAPFAKITDTEIFIEENDFKFYSKPYFLRLTLPGNIVEDGREQANYDAGKGVFVVVVPKVTPGEHFEGLNMITKLLVPKGATSAAKPLIEVIDAYGGDHPDGPVDVEDEEIDWCLPQTPYQPQCVLPGAPKYGFANQKSGVFQTLQEELCGVVDCPDPDKLTMVERRDKRLAIEATKFDEDHYLGDQHDDDMIQVLLYYSPSWYAENEMVTSGTPVDIAVDLTDEDKEIMRKLPKREYLLDKAEETVVYLGLVDIIFAYAYNHRTTEGENTVESGWTISKISATLSWLEVFGSVDEVVLSCYRRCLCYPLYRHWQINMAVLLDIQHIFKLGRRRLLKCLLEVRRLLMDTESRYVLNDLYITDYCVWIQSANEKKLQSLAEAISKVKLSKDDVGFDLLEVERLAQIAMQEDEDEVTKVVERMAKVSVKPSARDSDDSASDESDTTESDVTSSDDLVSDDEVDSQLNKKELQAAVAKDTEISSNTLEYDTGKGCNNSESIGKVDILSGTKEASTAADLLSGTKEASNAAPKIVVISSSENDGFDTKSIGVDDSTNVCGVETASLENT